jgi:hypothetical protein
MWKAVAQSGCLGLTKRCGDSDGERLNPKNPLVSLLVAEMIEPEADLLDYVCCSLNIISNSAKLSLQA